MRADKEMQAVGIAHRDADDIDIRGATTQGAKVTTSQEIACLVLS
jgi:hypothetical protein